MLPDHGFIGAEPFLNGVADRARATSATSISRNVRLWRGDALEVLQRVPDGALSFLYLLHPDPWPKARHAKRRMVNDRPVDLFAAKLKPGGEFRLATDDPTYLTWALMIMQRHAAAVRMAGRAARGFPRTAGRLDRNPLRRQVAARGPPALLSPLPPRLSRASSLSSRAALAVLEQIDGAVRALVDRRGCAGPCPTGRPCVAWSPRMSDMDQRLARQRADSASPFHCGNRSPV